MTTKRKLLVILSVVAVAAVVAVVAANGSPRAAEVGDPVGQPVGGPLILSSSEQEFLRNVEEGSRNKLNFTGDTYLLSSHDSASMYRSDRTDGGACYIAQRASLASRYGRFGSIACSERFPAHDALLDFSTVEIVRGENESPHFINAQGVAADGVKLVQALSEDGTVLAEARVTNNVYWLDLPPGGAAVKIVALDDGGKPMGSIPD